MEIAFARRIFALSPGFSGKIGAFSILWKYSQARLRRIWRIFHTLETFPEKIDGHLAEIPDPGNIRGFGEFSTIWAPSSHSGSISNFMVFPGSSLLADFWGGNSLCPAHICPFPWFQRQDWRVFHTLEIFSGKIEAHLAHFPFFGNILKRD